MTYNPIAAAEAVFSGTLAEWDAWVDQTPPNAMSPKAYRSLQEFGTSYKASVRGQQRANYDSHKETSKGNCADRWAEVDAIRAEIKDLIEGARSGRITGAVLRRQAAAVHKYLPEVREKAAAHRAAEDRAWEAICQEPADFQAAQLERMPMLQRTLPTLTAGYLNGERDASHNPFINE